MSSPSVNLFSKEEFERFLGDVDDEEVQEDLAELKRLRGELDASTGQEYYNLLVDVNRTRDMLQENYLDLLHVIARYESNPEMAAGEDKEEIQDALGDFTREFHNYLAMCMSLSQHTMRARNKLERDGFEDDYQEMLRETGINDTNSFILDLRNYVQHRRVPVTTGQTSTEWERNADVQRSAEILIRKSQLLESDKWTNDSLEFLDGLESMIDIRSIVQDYQNSVREFYSWFFEELNTLYEEETKDRGELIIKIAKLQEKYFEGINEEFLDEEAQFT